MIGKKNSVLTSETLRDSWGMSTFLRECQGACHKLKLVIVHKEALEQLAPD